MIVEFLQDFRGRETNEAYYRKGDRVDLEDSIARRLIEDGRAKAVKYAANKHARDVQHRRRSDHNQ